MKVICIDDNWQCDEKETHFKKPSFGEIVIVRSTEKDEDNVWFYSLIGYVGYFEVMAFAPLSNIDETELVNEKELIN